MASPALTIDQEPIQSTRIILCEGSGDKNFFRELLTARNLPDFYITHPREEIDPGGRGGYTSRLRGLRLQPGFEAVTGIVVISDSDDSPNTSFQQVRTLIHEAEFHAPNHPSVFVAGPPAICVRMVPNENDVGQLETLCLSAVQTSWPDQYQCAEAYAQCTGVENWSRNKKEKAKFRALIAHICKKDPNTSLSYLWRGGREEVVPLAHAAFDDLATFLAGFDAAVTQAAQGV